MLSMKRAHLQLFIDDNRALECTLLPGREGGRCATPYPPLPRSRVMRDSLELFARVFPFCLIVRAKIHEA